MNSFGLGLVLNFTDNASAGMNRVSQTFSQLNGLSTQMVDSSNSAVFAVESLTAAGMGLTMVGEQISSAGQSILSVFASTSQAVIDTGMEMMGYRMQLQALYGENAFEDKMASIQEYAKNSVFEVQGLTRAVVTMKAVGIEAMNAVTSSSGNTTQTLMDYASDIAAMFPNMRNAYGTGVNAAMGALKEYIAEGNALSLKRGAGLDITSILGEDKGTSIEDRTRQVADLVEQLGIAGYTMSLMGTPTQQLSKMQDILFNTMSKISDGGVFDKYTNLLATLANWLDNLYEDTDRYEAIVSLLSDTLITVLTPLQSLLEYAIEIADAFIDWAIEHQNLAKGILIAVAAIGAFLLISGQVLKLSGGFFMLTSSIMNMSKLASNGISIFNIFGRSIGIVATKVLPLVGLAALLYTAWSKNLFGIRDTLTKVIKDMVATISLVVDAFADNTLSEENFQKAKNMGILPLIETILDLKYRFDFFKQGFVQGWTELTNKIVGAVTKITSALKGSIFDPIINKISEFFTKLSGTDTNAWTSVGEGVGKFVAMGVVITPIIKLVVNLATKMKGLIPIVKGIFSLITAHPVVAGIVAVIAVLVALYTKCEDFRNFVDGLFAEIGAIFKDSFGTILDTLKQSLTSLGPVLQNLKNAFLSFLPQVGEHIQRVVKFFGDLLSQVAKLVSGLLPVLIKAITTIMSAVFKILPIIMDIGNTIMDVIENLILPIIMDLIDLLLPFIVDLTDMASLLIDNVLTIVIGLLETVVPIINNLIALIVPMIRNIIESLMPLIRSIMNIIMSLMTKLMPVIQNIFVIVSAVIKTIINLLVPIIKVIVQIVEVIVTILVPILDVIITVIGFIIDIIVGIVSVVVSVITQIVVIITGIINVIVAIIDVIVQIVMAVVGVIVGIVRTIIETVVTVIKGIVLAVQTVWDTIVGVFVGAVDFFTGVFSAVFDVVTGIFQSIGDFFTNMWNGIVGAFNSISDTITGAIRSAINGVLGGAVNIINGFIDAINWCIGAINSIPGVSISKLTYLNVPQLAEGGVVNKPTLAEIGEDGQEAVVPLENNTGWIDKVAEKVAPKLVTAQEQKGLSIATPKQEVHNDYSVTFAAGSVVIQLANATDAELEKAAEKLMKIIERKQQLKALAVRA